MRNRFAMFALVVVAALSSPRVGTEVAPRSPIQPQEIRNPLGSALFTADQECLRECLSIYRSCSLNCAIDPDPSSCDSGCTADYNACRAGC